MTGRDRDDDAGVHRPVHRPRDQVARGLDLGLAQRQVDHVHPVRDGGLDAGCDLRRVPVQADAGRRRDGQHLVVADVCAGRDPRDGRAPADRGRVRVAGGDPGDVSGVGGELGVEGQSRVLPARRRGHECARDDHLRRREGGVALREPGRVRVSGRVEERMSLVDAVVEDRDLDPVAVARERGRRGGGKPAGRTGGVEGRRVARPADDPCDARHRGELSQALLGKRDREAVEHDPVPPADVRAGNCPLDPPGERVLLGRERPQVVDAGRAAEAEPPVLGRGAQRAALGDRLGERRRLHRHHDLDRRGARGGRRRPEGGEQNEEDQTPAQGRDIVDARLQWPSPADVAELVDAHGSGPCGRKPVEVQVLSSA